MKKVRSSTKTVTIIILLNVLVFGVLIGLFYEVRKKNQQISHVQNEIEFETKKVDRLKKLEELVQTTAEDREKLDRYFLDKADMVAFISQLEQLGKDANSQVVLSDISEQEVKGEPYIYLSLNIATAGTWDQVVKYVSLLESLPYIIKIDSFQLHLDDAGGKGIDPLWSCRVALRALMMK